MAVLQVRDSLTRFVSSVIPDTKGIVRTRPLETLVIGAYVRRLSLIASALFVAISLRVSCSLTRRPGGRLSV